MELKSELLSEPAPWRWYRIWYK